MRRWVLLLVALAIAAGPVAFAAPASADDVCGGQGGPCFAVSVVGENQPPTYLPWSRFEKDHETAVQNNNDCLVRSKPGTPEVNGCNPASPGISVQTLLTDAGIPVTAVKLLQVSESGSAPSTLTADELATDPSPFENDWVPAFALFGGGILFNRPLLDNPNDTNAGEDVSTSFGGEMDVVVYPSATVLHPTVQVPGKAAAGVPFTATATLAPGESAAGLTYSWNFYFGPVEPKPATTTHTYPKGTPDGTYGVSVTVERYVGTTLSAYGTSQPVVVTVGAPATTPPATGPTGGSGTGKKHHPPTGPNKGKGRQPGGAPGKNGGAGNTTPTSTPSSSSTPPTPATGAATPTSGSTGGASTAATGPTTAPPAAAGATGRHHKSAPAAGANFGALVQGVVIDSAAQPVAAAPASTARPATAESARRRSAQPFDARLLWWLLLPVLLGLGVLSEVRRPRPRRAPNA